MLVLDVDGVLLDPTRGGAGHWTIELERRFGITERQMAESFFSVSWTEVLTGRAPIEPALAAAIESIGASCAVDDVLDCWFAADFVPFDVTVALARDAIAAGVPVALATNQEHRRAAYLRQRVGELFPIEAIVYSAAAGAQKHRPAFFAYATAALAPATPADLVFVDDNEPNVIQARAAGWRAVYAPPGLGWIGEVRALLDLG